MKQESLWEKAAGGVRILAAYLQKTLFSDFYAFVRWLLIALVCGFVIGGAGAVFHIAIARAEVFRAAHQGLYLLLPAGGLVIAFLYKKSGMEADPGRDLVLVSDRTEASVS